MSARDTSAKTPRVQKRRGLRWWLKDLVDGFELRHSTSKVIDGVWIGTWEKDPEKNLRVVEQALSLIKTHDRLRYGRLVRDLERVWVRVLFGARGSFNSSLKACQLDTRFVLAHAESPEIVASVIVHEATHARLQRCGVGYREELRPRVEIACVRRERAFARRLPNADHLLQWAEEKLKWCAVPGNLTDVARDEEDVEGRLEALRWMKAPAWVQRSFRVLAALKKSMRRPKS